MGLIRRPPVQSTGRLSSGIDSTEFSGESGNTESARLSRFRALFDRVSAVSAGSVLRNLGTVFDGFLDQRSRYCDRQIEARYP